MTNSSSHVTDYEDISIENLIKSEDYVPVQLDTVTFEQGSLALMNQIKIHLRNSKSLAQTSII